MFAKSDVQPLINQGARTEDIAASIYKAVVNQTIAGLAQGRPIQGNILYLGGPLTFSTVLRKSFDEALGVTGTCPENSLLYVALGAALYADKEFVLSDVAAALDEYAATATYASEPPAVRQQGGVRGIPCPPYVPQRAAGGVQRPVRPGAYRHRLRLHHRQAGGRGRAEPDPLHQLSAQPRQPAAPHPGAAAEDL